MQTKTLLIIVAAAALVAACDRNAPQSSNQPSSSSGASQTQSSTPADLPKPTQGEKSEGANPTQGQVDPKEPAQHRDFQQKGDAQGPTSADTTPGK